MIQKRLFLQAACGLALFVAPALAPAQTVDELLNITPPPAQTQPADTAVTPLDPEVLRKLTGEEPGDVFESAVAEMSEASDRLAKERDAGDQTQRIQESVLAKLDQVIEAVEQQQQQQQNQSSQPQQQQHGSQQNQAKQQQQASAQQQDQASQSNTGGKAPMGNGQADGRPLSELRSEWGNLPPRLRDELLQGINEKFSPIYRELTEDYFRSTAEKGKE
jgi:hypothetical protein